MSSGWRGALPPAFVFIFSGLLSSSAFASGGVELEATGGILSGEAWGALLTGAGLAAVVTLTGLEIVLGIDNIVFITVLTARLPEDQRPKARRLGLLAAMVSRIALLLVVGWLMRLQEPLFQVPFINGDEGVSGKDLILILGGAFLLYKATKEIHHKVEGAADEEETGRQASSMASALAQIMLVDLVFSLDSVITAVGMTGNIPVMVVAVVLSVTVMMVAAQPIGGFVERHPSIKVLALSFLVLIGVLLVAEGFGQHLNKGYIYFAMAFSLVVDLLQLRMSKKSAPAT